jgi:hypothetical protein
MRQLSLASMLFSSVAVSAMALRARPAAAQPPSPGPPGSALGHAAAKDTSAREDLDTKAAARTLFEEGLAHADAHRWEQAADRFERASLLRPTPVIDYNLSSALVQVGDLVRASELLRQIAADPKASAEVKQAARAQLAELRPRLAYLRIDPPGDQLRQAKVVVDGHPFDAARLGVELPVNPASHSIELREGSLVVGSRTVLLREGEHRRVTPGPELPRVQAARLQRMAAASTSTGRGNGIGTATGTTGTITTTNLLGAPGFDPRGDDTSDSNSLAAKAGQGRSRTWIWVTLGAVVAGVTTAVVIASRSDTAPPAGNAGTWMLGSK